MADTAQPIDEASVAAEPMHAPRAGAIVIARHGKPALERRSVLDWRGYCDWWRRYDEGGLAPDQSPPPELVAEARDADVILASPLQRSVETAQAIADGRPIAFDPVFVEAPLPPPRLPGLRLRPGPWGVLARITWWLGFSFDQESRRQAERRADVAVARLLDHAHAGHTVVLCAHGWFNRMMRPVLMAHGWTCVRDGGDQHWSHRRYELRSRDRSL